MIKPERQIEESLVAKLRDLKYEYRTDICDREVVSPFRTAWRLG